ncbi:MAG: helix-turn-helix transcriptional regulator [Crocosphaera sp.]
MFKPLITTIMMGSLLLPIPKMAIASDMVKTIPAHNGSTKQLQPVHIPLAIGSGISINFASSGERIQKVWLDNPSFVTLDSDGCLAGLPSSGNCQDSNASIIYLRRINDLSIPGLPKTHQSLLTIITETQGEKNVYLFRIVKANSPSKLIFEVVPNRPRNGNQTIPSTEPTVITTARIINGFKRAITNKLLEKEGNLSQQINEFIGYLESGLSKAEAAQKVGVSQAVINKLEALGR